MSEVFKLPVRIYYEDTDAGGVVYYANYLRYAERARTEFLRYHGFEQKEGMDLEEKFGFMVRHVEVDYKLPAVLDDLIHVSCQVIEAKGASCKIKQEIIRGEELLVSLNVEVVYVSYAKKRPTRIPPEMMEKFV